MINKIFIFLYLSITYMPLFGEIDRIGSQSLFLSIINLFALGYIYQSKKLDNLISLFKKKEILLYVGFIFFVLISAFSAINLAEFAIEFFRTFNYFVALLVFLTLLSDKKHSDFLVRLILFFLLIDVLGITLQFAQGLPLLGFSANKNIVSFSVAIKLNILLFFFYKLKNVFIKIFVFILYGYAYYLILNINSKGAILITNISLVIYLTYFVFNFRENKGKVFNILLVLFAVISINFIDQKNNFSKTIQGTITNFSQETGNTSRLRYYRQALESFFDNPIFGIGHGNWKIVSTKYDAKEMRDYVVQYYSHNDFIQVLAEVGIFGFLTYSGFLILIFLKTIKHINNKRNNHIFLFLILALTTYLFDALINFPAGRVLSQLNLVVLITLISINSQNE